MNADINASAGIVDTKLATISTSGKVSNSATTATTSTTAATIALRDSNGVVPSAFIQTGTGATTRTVDAKLKDTVSVKDFGAVGDGVTNDTAAIAAALVYCASTGKALEFVRGGTYLTTSSFSSPIQVGCNINGNNATINGVVKVQGNNLVIKDFHLISTSSYFAFIVTGSVSIPLYFTGVTVENVRVTFGGLAIPQSLGFSATNITDLRIINCNILYGISLIGCENYAVSGCILDGDNFSNEVELIHASYKSFGIISDNTFVNSLDNYIDLYSSGAKTVIVGNRFLGCKTRLGTAIEIKVALTDDPSNTSSNTTGWSEQILIDGNYFGNTIAFAAQFTTCMNIYYIDNRAAPSFTWAETPRNIIISNNIFDGFDATLHGVSYFTAIKLTKVTAVSIVGNIFRDMAFGATGNPASSCVWIEGCRGVSVSDNVMSMNGGTGISLHDTCYEISITNNHLLEDLNKAFTLTCGIRIQKIGSRPDPVVYESKFTGNTVYSSTYGIFVPYAAALSFTKCVVANNYFKSPVSIANVTSCILSGNSFTTPSATYSALNIGSASSISAHNTIVGNQLFGPNIAGTVGISLVRCRGSNISNNTAKEFAYGLYVTGTNTAGELDYLNIKDNFSVAQIAPLFPTYVSMNAADTALLQAVNNQIIT